MPKTPPLSPHTPSIPEICDFDEGLKRIRERIAELLEEKDDVVLGINGSAPRVSKPLTRDIVGSFFAEDIPTGISSGLDGLLQAATAVTDQRKRFRSDKGLYIIDDSTLPHGLKTIFDKKPRSLYDLRLQAKANDIVAPFADWVDKEESSRPAFATWLKETSRDSLLPLSKVDLWVAISTADKPFNNINERLKLPYDPFEDVIIRYADARRKLLGNVL